MSSGDDHEPSDDLVEDVLRRQREYREKRAEAGGQFRLAHANVERAIGGWYGLEGIDPADLDDAERASLEATLRCVYEARLRDRRQDESGHPSETEEAAAWGEDGFTLADFREKRHSVLAHLADAESEIRCARDLLGTGEEIDWKFSRDAFVKARREISPRLPSELLVTDRGSIQDLQEDLDAANSESDALRRQLGGHAPQPERGGGCHGCLQLQVCLLSSQRTRRSAAPSPGFRMG